MPLINSFDFWRGSRPEEYENGGRPKGHVRFVLQEASVVPDAGMAGPVVRATSELSQCPVKPRCIGNRLAEFASVVVRHRRHAGSATEP